MECGESNDFRVETVTFKCAVFKSKPDDPNQTNQIWVGRYKILINIWIVRNSKYFGYSDQTQKWFGVYDILFFKMYILVW